jgi:flagellar basal body rod protein FlgG
VDSGFYAACAGLRAKTQALEIVANNVANLNSTGYRSHQATFRSLLMGERASSGPLNRVVNSFGVLGGSRLDLGGGNTSKQETRSTLRSKAMRSSQCRPPSRHSTHETGISIGPRPASF